LVACAGVTATEPLFGEPLGSRNRTPELTPGSEKPWMKG